MNEPLLTREQWIAKWKQGAKECAVDATKAQREGELTAQVALILSVGVSVASVISPWFLLGSAMLTAIALVAVGKGQRDRVAWLVLRQERLDFAARLEREDW